MLPLAFLLPVGAGLLQHLGAAGPVARASRCSAISCRLEDRAGATGRRELLLGSAAFFLSASVPNAADASYALYKASQDSFNERKSTGYKPVATSDKETLAEIQADIARKRPRSEVQLKRKPQYCAGQMGTVQPMMENICENIGLTKADQSNTMVDSYGNMNVGAFAEKLERESRERELAAKAARAAGRSS